MSENVYCLYSWITTWLNIKMFTFFLPQTIVHIDYRFSSNEYWVLVWRETWASVLFCLLFVLGYGSVCVCVCVYLCVCVSVLCTWKILSLPWYSVNFTRKHLSVWTVHFALWGMGIGRWGSRAWLILTLLFSPKYCLKVLCQHYSTWQEASFPVYLWKSNLF